jgi:hypothetical protein
MKAGWTRPRQALLAIEIALWRQGAVWGGWARSLCSAPGCGWA